MILLISLLLLSVLPLHASTTPCNATIGGKPIHSVYIVGTDTSAVAWAYKNLTDDGCINPVTDARKADAILNLTIPGKVRSADDSEGLPDASFSVSCATNSDSTLCTDSDGNQLITSCGPNGCSSYYGANPLADALGELRAALRKHYQNAWYNADASLYSVHGKLFWTAKPGDLWDDSLRSFTGQPKCKKNVFSRARNWRELASEHCHIEMQPRVSIDLNEHPTPKPIPVRPTIPDAVAAAVAERNSTN